MAKSNWSYLQGERRTGEYEEMTVRSIGHWWMGENSGWPDAVRNGYHLFSETGVGMIEPTALVINDPSAYRDRHKLTYRSYVLQQDAEEKKLDALLEGARKRGTFALIKMPASIRRAYIPALRHYFWGSGMMRIYAAAYTPCGPVMNTLLFQIFDCMRHAQRFVELSWDVNQDASVDSLSMWLDWQPLQPTRRYVETGLSLFDWGETFVAVNYVFDPVFLPLHDILVADIPEQAGDWAITQFWQLLAEDLQRHKVSGCDFVAAMIEESGDNMEVIQGWVNRWLPMALQAIDALAPLVEEARSLGYPRSYPSIRDEILSAYEGQLARNGLVLPSHIGEFHESKASISG